MTTAQLIFVIISAIAGGMLSAGAWRSASTMFTRKRKGPIRLSGAHLPETKPQAGPSGPPKPASADIAPETDQVLRAISRLQSTVTDLARVQLDIVKKAPEQVGEPVADREDFDRMERALKALPGMLRKDFPTQDPQDEDRRAKRLEARLDKCVRAASVEQSDILTPRLDKMEAQIADLAGKIGVTAARAMTRDELVDALTGATTTLDTKFQSALRAVEERLEEANQSLVSGITHHLSRPDPQRDRIEMLLNALMAQSSDVSQPVPEASTAAINGYRAAPVSAIPAVQPGIRSVGEETAPEPVGEPAEAAEQPNPVELSQSEQRLLRTHPGLASILLNKNRIRSSGSG